jgi:hypothetical protein
MLPARRAKRQRAGSQKATTTRIGARATSQPTGVAAFMSRSPRSRPLPARPPICTAAARSGPLRVPPTIGVFPTFRPASSRLPATPPALFWMRYPTEAAEVTASWTATPIRYHRQIHTSTRTSPTTCSANLVGFTEYGRSVMIGS